MTDLPPEQEVELVTSIFSGIDHLIELLKDAPYSYVRVMAADLVAAFAILEQEKDHDVPEQVLESQTGMLTHLLAMARRKMARDWTELDVMVFGLEAAETSIRIHHQATTTGLTKTRVAVSILALMFLKPEDYIRTLQVRNPE